jgi:hypothetical protein
MRTILVGLIVLVRFGPDIAYAASLSMTPAPSSVRSTTSDELISPPASILVRPARRPEPAAPAAGSTASAVIGRLMQN